MSDPIGQAERDRNAALRAQHTCTRDMSSMRCSACNRGVPYPPIASYGASLDELLDAMFPQRPRR